PSQTASMLWLGGEQFARPCATRPAGTIESPCWGNAGVGILERPGFANFDVRVNRRIPLGADGRHSLELRGEAFNMTNTTQFQGIDTTARFDAAGSQINALF